MHPEPSECGPLPPHDAELIRAFLEGTPFLFTGSQRWNALALGATAAFAVPSVYNTKRSGDFVFGQRHFKLRRKPFPADPPPEWTMVDLIGHYEVAGVGRRPSRSNLRGESGTGGSLPPSSARWPAAAVEVVLPVEGDALP